MECNKSPRVLVIPKHQNHNAELNRGVVSEKKRVTLTSGQQGITTKWNNQEERTFNRPNGNKIENTTIQGAKQDVNIRITNNEIRVTNMIQQRNPNGNKTDKHRRKVRNFAVRIQWTPKTIRKARSYYTQTNHSIQVNAMRWQNSLARDLGAKNEGRGRGSRDSEEGQTLKNHMPLVYISQSAYLL